MRVDGVPLAAGHWCPVWSPTGRRLAMLSTSPEGEEPRGGDNVRLYVWELGHDGVRRVSNDAVASQTQGGSPFYRMDVRDRTGEGQRCGDDDNAPFTWLDDQRLLAVTLPKGRASGLIDAAARPQRHVEETAARLAAGGEPTFTAVDSGAAAPDPAQRDGEFAVLKVYDVEAGVTTHVGELPLYPFRGELTVAVSPNARSAAILATSGTLPLGPLERLPFADNGWIVRRELGLVPLDRASSGVDWIGALGKAALPLDLWGWSPTSKAIAFRARGAIDQTEAAAFLLDAEKRTVLPVGTEPFVVGGSDTGSWALSAPPIHWLGDEELLVYGRKARAPGVPKDWWRFPIGGSAVRLTEGEAAPPDRLVRDGRHSLVGVAGGALWRIKSGRLIRTPIPAAAGAAARLIGAGLDNDNLLLLAGQSENGPIVGLIDAADPRAYQRVATLEADERILAYSPSAEAIVSVQSGQRGTEVIARDRGSAKVIWAGNRQLQEVDWGTIRIFEYSGGNGAALKAGVILPPGWSQGTPPPALLWVYPGYLVDGQRDFWFGSDLPGFYNLQLYAAQGYAIIIPSIPLTRGAQADLIAETTTATIAAADKAVALGFADPERLGVFGQSFGGFGAAAIVTASDRFKAAVAIAGFTDLGSLYSRFSAEARGYPRLEHERSENWQMIENGPIPLDQPPWQIAEIYSRNSPLQRVNRVTTPILLLHGEMDLRGDLGQAESFFFSLYRQGKKARLLRFWGENHGIAMSPANTRSVFKETIRWFDQFVKNFHGSSDGEVAP